MWRRLVIGLALLALPAGLVAQDLGRLAEQEKARREKAKKSGPPAKVYTDDDLKSPEKPKASPPGAEGAAAARGSEPSRRRAVEPGSGPPESDDTREAAAPPPRRRSSEAADTGDDGAWAGRLREASTAVASAERRVAEIQSQIDALRAQLNPMSTTFERDAYRIPEIQARLTDADNEKSQAEQQLKEARDSLAQVQEQARRAGVSPNVPSEPPR